MAEKRIPVKGSERRPAHGAVYVGPADPAETATTTIVLRRRPDGPPIPGQDFFATTPLDMRGRMTPDEFAAKYGAAPDDIDKVTQFAQAHGLSAVETNTARRSVVVSGTVCMVAANPCEPRTEPAPPAASLLRRHGRVS
jgi:kumamolisin